MRVQQHVAECIRTGSIRTGSIRTGSIRTGRIPVRSGRAQSPGRPDRLRRT
jgi:hypothetical protein